MSEIKTTGELKNKLIYHTGSENFYKNTSGLIYTEGIKEMADLVGAHWLIDLVDSYKKERINKPFLLWRVEVMDSKAVVTAKEDSGEPTVVAQNVSYTDFPEGDFEFYVIDGTMLLKGEY